MSSARLCALVVAALTTLPASAHAAVPVGLADQHAAALRDERVAWLGITSARVVAPWDAALEPSPELDDWLRTARERGLDALVSFGRRRGEDCRSGTCRLPSELEMRAAFTAFRARWPWVTAFGTWNESNHPSQPTADDPAGTARLYQTLVAACPQCRILAVEVLDIQNMLSWLRRFRGSLQRDPGLWGLHNYGDVTRGSTAMTEALLAAVDGTVWITETGGLVRQTGADGTAHWPYDEERARLAVARSLRLAEAHADRIERLFIYQWQAAAHEPWDSGLIRPDFTPRPSFTELAAWLRPAAPPPLSVLERPPPPRRAPTALELVRRPWFGRPGMVRARVYCPAAAPRSCRARLTVRTVAGRRVGVDATRVRPGASAPLAVRLPARARRQIRLGRTTRLAAEIRAGTDWRRRFVIRCRR